MPQRRAASERERAAEPLDAARAEADALDEWQQATRAIRAAPTLQVGTPAATPTNGPPRPALRRPKAVVREQGAASAPSSLVAAVLGFGPVVATLALPLAVAAAPAVVVARSAAVS